MNTMRIMPEGWNNEVTKLNQTNVEQYIKNNETVQGLVKKCDDNYNLYVSFENGLNGIIPRKDVEGINLQENGKLHQTHPHHRGQSGVLGNAGRTLQTRSQLSVHIRR